MRNLSKQEEKSWVLIIFLIVLAYRKWKGYVTALSWVNNDNDKLIFDEAMTSAKKCRY